MFRNSAFSLLLGATALTSGLVLNGKAVAQPLVDCGELIDGETQPGCEQPNAGQVDRVPVAANTEPDVGLASNQAGFSISLDGDPIDSDPTLEDRIRQVDLDLAEADIRVSFDGFDPKTRLSVEPTGAPRVYRPGETVTLQSELNYPAFVSRGEFRVIDRNATGGPRLMTVVPVEPNGQARFVVPEGRDIVVVHRVYDARGRFDETAPLPLFSPNDRGLTSEAEEGADTASVRNIRVVGGAVTVSANNVAQGAVVRTLGEAVRPDPNGRMVIQRILPPGTYAVDVEITGGARDTDLRRDIEIPSSEWFYHGLADLTYGIDDEYGEPGTTGRLQFFADGRTADGWQITGSIDTTEDDIQDIFRRLDEKDPRSVLERLDPEDSYPTFGDDSTIEDLTPTSGRVYLRIERDGNFGLIGDFQSRIEGSSYLRNERTLYGAQGYYASQDSTSRGQPRTEIEVYAAGPEQLVGREVFQGTGGSVYFLRRQDISPGTETVTIEVRDTDTGRVTERRLLTRGIDYDVNALLGVVTLTRPLTGSTGSNLIQTNVGGDEKVNLVVQYEFTPVGTDVDSLSLGGRAETWVTDQIRIGLTAINEDTGTADQNAQSVDLRYEFGANSYLQFDVARSDGPGFTTDFSADGGLTIDGNTVATGSGEALKFEGQADLQDLGYGRSGVIGGYFEQRTEGFSTLDYQVTATTGDETLYGFFHRVDKTDDAFGYALYADVYENDAGSDKTEIGAEVFGNISERLSFAAGVEQLDETTATTDGSRTDIAARLEFEANPNVTYAFFGQGAISTDGLDEYNRLGFGIDAALNDEWRLESELSTGTGGVGGRLLATYENEDGSSRYFGYELDRGRALQAGTSQQDNGGKFIAGGRQILNDDVTMYGENIYDIFDGNRTLTTAYGVDYRRSDFLSYDASVEHGQVNDELDRTALGFGMNYDNDALRASARLEFRVDEAAPTSTFDDLDAVYFDAAASYKIDEARRLVFSVGLADSNSDTDSSLGGTLVDANFGYAFRPINNERLNFLAHIRYLRDEFGQTIDGVAGAGDTQESAIFSVEANYDLSRQWTLGGKIGGRFSSTDDGTGPIDNDAYLAVLNARYHVVHKWDFLLEARHLNLVDAGSSETAALGAAYRHINNNAKIGIGYNFGSFSDDLSDLERDDHGLFVNLTAKF